MNQTVGRLIIAGVVLFGWGMSAVWADPPIGPEPVRVIVVTILAHDRDDQIDPKLQPVAKMIRKRDPSLTGFEVHNSATDQIPIGESKTFKLIEEATVEVTVEAKDDGRISLTVTPPKSKGSITYSCSCGKFFPVMTRYITANNERVIVALMAKPCHGN